MADLTFRDLTTVLPRNALLLVNDSRVVAARLHLHRRRPTAVDAALSEVMCLSPSPSGLDPAVALRAESGDAVWVCMLRGKKIKVGDEFVLEHGLGELDGELDGEGLAGTLRMRLVVEERNGKESTCRFFWEQEAAAAAETAGGAAAPPPSGSNRADLKTFGAVLEELGRMPLPPYMNREAEESDREGYQTVYARAAGSVAAPTAGLHFDDEMLGALAESRADVDMVRLTLHVGAGTFAPLEGDAVADHAMHAERIEVERRVLHELLEAFRAERPLVPVGTTSVRTLETLYWLGVKELVGSRDEGGEGGAGSGGGGGGGVGVLTLDQWDPYTLAATAESEGRPLPTPTEALTALERHRFGEAASSADADADDDASVVGVTSLLIMPGYRFAMCDALQTNFHQPRSTLLLLVSGLLGGREALGALYEHALAGPYRFLSFGDCSFLTPAPSSKLFSSGTRR